MFEGLKAYKTSDGKVQLFRPYMNAKRTNKTNDRLCIPQIDEDGLPDVEYMVEKGYQTRFYQYRFDKDKNYLWPIPASDLLVNDNLTQNPGY